MRSRDNFEDIGESKDVVEIALTNKNGGKENYFINFKFFRTDIQYMNRYCFLKECQ
ncbi:hypothetical protein AAEX28_13715 [Lentisphaerota bacterium WC36G]|nr:hypothetical protein LJT99_00470 [Lentisphaerae bacterium WC36]